MDDPAPRRGPKRSRRVLLLSDPASEPLRSGKKPRSNAPDFPPPVETPSRPPTANAASRAPDDLVVVCVGEGGDSSALGKIPPAARAITEHVGDIDEVRRLKSGALVFIARSKDQVSTLLSLNKFCNIPVCMRPPKSRPANNYGVISGINTDADISAIRTALVQAGATEFMRLQRRLTDGSLQDTRSLRVAFAAGLPEYVKINFERFPVRPYVHRPLQCFKCERYGHGASSCRSSQRCGKCSGPHATRDCTSSEEQCAICKLAHPAWSRTCAFNVRARQVEATRASEGLTYAEAARRVPPVKTPKPHPDISMTSVGTQTDPPAKPATADAATTTRGACAHTRLPTTSTLLTRTNEPNGPEYLFLKDTDIPNFIAICFKIIGYTHNSDLADLASTTLDEFLDTLPESGNAQFA